MVAPPAPQVPGVAPIPPPLSSQFSSGGSTKGGSTGTGGLALSPGAASGSPSEAAKSAPGGGGKSLADCMAFWEPATHMTKQQWRTACKRTMQVLR